ncbi:MAG: SRPBCC family protein [Chloroflexia bacterium]
MEKPIVERSIWIKAPRERVWQALIEPEHLERWLLPAAMGARLKRDDTGKLSVLMGPMEVDLALLEALDPPRQVSFLNLPDKLLASTYILEDENGGTGVTLALVGLESLPEEAAQERLGPGGAGCEMALETLKAYIEGTELPHPQGFAGGLFGYHREARQKLSVERSIWIAAPRERVWRAITEPDQLDKWFSPGAQWRGTGLEAGGRIFVLDPATNTEMYTQVIELVDPPRQLVTRSAPEPPEAPHVTTWSLMEDNGGTRLTITFSGFELEPEDVRWMNMEQHAFGFGMMLTNLAAHIEGRSLPYPQGF